MGDEGIITVKIDGVIKRYGEKTVLSVPSLEVEQGKITGIIGLNGSGKTTLLQVVANLVTPDTGVILYNGELFNESLAKKVTLLFQKPYMITGTVEYNLKYPLIIRGFNSKKIVDLVTDISQELGISALLSRDAKTLSGGETQKVAFARATIFQPNLIILDEATSGLDVPAIRLLERKLLNLKKQKTTVLMVTHNIAQAKRICDNVLFLNKGEILAYGTFDEAIMGSNNRLICDFIAEAKL